MSFKDFLIVLGVTFGWGLSFTLGKLAIHDVPPFFMMACRFILVVAVALPFIKFPREHLKPLMLLAFVLGFFHYGTTYIALRDLSTGMTALLTQMQLPMTFIMAWAFYGEKPTRFQLLGLGVAFVGLYGLVGQPEIKANLWPTLIILASAFAVALSGFIKKKYAAIPPYTATVYIALFSLPLHMLVSAVSEGSPVVLAHQITWGAGIAIVYMALLSSILCLSGWLYLLSRYPVSKVSSYALMIPVFGYGTAAMLLGEGITLPIAVASAIILIGLYFMQKSTSVISAPEEA